MPSQTWSPWAVSRQVSINMATMDMPPPSSAPAGALSARPRGSKSPMDRRNISPYLNTASISPGKLSPKGKGAHISTIKSLGLLHDLQEYISTVEAVTVEQKLELSRLKDEKKEIEKAVYKLEVQADKGHSTDFFRASEIADLPPKLRAIFEENKIMKEKLRKHKSKMSTLEQQVAAKNTQIIAMEDTLTLLKQQLAACSRTPADVEREEVLKDQLMTKERRISSLEHEVSILKQKLETDSKLHRQTLQGAKREQESIKKQVVLAHATLEEQDKELRASRLEIKRLSRFLAPSRGPPIRSLHQSHTEADMHQVLHDRATEQVSTSAPQLTTQQAPAADAASVHLMICLLRDEDGKQPPSGMITLSPPVQVTKPAAPAQAPVQQPTQPEMSLDDVNLVSTPQESQENVAPPQSQPAEPRTEMEEAADKLVAAFRLAHPGGEAPGEPKEPHEQPPDTAPPPSEAPQEQVEAVPPETHASEPRSVPYRHTAARAESKKSLDSKPSVSKQSSSLGHRNSQGSKTGSKQSSENGDAKGSLKNSRSSSQTSQGKPGVPLPPAPAAAAPAPLPPADEQSPEVPTAAEPESNAAPAEPVELVPQPPPEVCEGLSPAVEEHVEVMAPEQEAGQEEQSPQPPADEQLPEVSTAAEPESSAAPEPEELVPQPPPEVCEGLSPAVEEHAEVMAPEQEAAQEEQEEQTQQEEEHQAEQAEASAEAPSADEQAVEAAGPDASASGGEAGDEPVQPEAEAEAASSQSDSANVEQVAEAEPETSHADVSEPAALEEQPDAAGEASGEGEAAAEQAEGDAASTGETEKVSFLSSTASDVDTLHSNEAPAEEASAPAHEGESGTVEAEEAD